MSNRLLLIVNPHAGKRKVKDCLFEIINAFTENGKNVTVYPTKNKIETIAYIKNNAADFEAVVVCGGDGTLNEAVNGLMQCGKRIPLGYIPFGSTNDFASSLDIPSICLSATKKIIQGNKFAYDLGCLNGSYFTYIACAGAFAETSYLTSQNLKNRLGHFAYLLSSVKSLHTLRKTSMTITAPNFSVSGDFLFTAILNSLNAGGVLDFSKEKIVFNDGLFELLLIKMPKDIIDFSALIKDLLNADLKNKNISIHKVSECNIKVEKEIGWAIDGEDGGSSKEIDFKVISKSIDFIL